MILFSEEDLCIRAVLFNLINLINYSILKTAGLLNCMQVCGF